MSVESLDPTRWNALVPGFRDLSFTHCWAYGEADAARLGATSEHVAVMDGDRVLGLADVRVKSLPLFGGGIAYVNGGPLCRVDEVVEVERLAACLGALRDHYLGRGLIFRALLPIGPPASNERVAARLREEGWRPASQGRRYRTQLLDLAPGEEALRAGLSRRWRRQLKRGEASALEIQESEETELFDAFESLYAQMRDRKLFDATLGPAFYRGLQRALPGDQRLAVSIARVDGAPAAGTVMSMHGDTCVYLLGASNDAGRDARASYVLHWRTVLAARKRGLRWYDLGGIDPQGNPGVTTFKEGMGGVEAVAPGPFEMRPGGLRPRLTRAAEVLYARLRERRPRTGT